MNATERRQRVRRWLAGEGCVYGPNVYDPLSARVAEDVGFELGLLTAHGAEWMVNGGNELCRVTITELAEQARRICRASDLSILVTGPFGFGNAFNEMRYVEELERAGVSIVTIGDQVLPSRFGTTAQHEPPEHTLDEEPQVSVEEFVGKIKAALAARQDPSLVIGARTNSLVVADRAAATRRVKAYEMAGAEVLWVTHATKEGIEALHRATTMPIIMGGRMVRGEWGSRNRADPEIQEFLKANGVRLGSLGNIQIRAAMKAYYEAFTALRDGSLNDVERIALSKEKFLRVTQLSRDNEMIKSFLN